MKNGLEELQSDSIEWTTSPSEYHYSAAPWSDQGVKSFYSLGLIRGCFYSLFFYYWLIYYYYFLPNVITVFESIIFICSCAVTNDSCSQILFSHLLHFVSQLCVLFCVSITHHHSSRSLVKIFFPISLPLID